MQRGRLLLLPFATRAGVVMTRANASVYVQHSPSASLVVAKGGSVLQPYLIEDSRSRPSGHGRSAVATATATTAAAAVRASGDSKPRDDVVVVAAASGYSSFLERVHVAFVEASRSR